MEDTRVRVPVGRATVLAVLLLLSAGLAANAAYADWTMHALTERLLADAATVTDAELDEGRGFHVVAGKIQGYALLATAAVFIGWFHKMRVNAEVFAPGADKRSPDWAIAAWFIPFVNLWLPYRIARATWGSSTAHGPDGDCRRRPLTLVAFWWGAFVLARVLGWGGGLALSFAQSPAAASHAVAAMLAGDILDIVAAVLAVLFVLRLTAMQRAKVACGPHVETDR
ncbi:DUF4328 domain-containing protein [Streptomyces sp. NPDC060232]|uniref:DUF4328 domain-containing protein n=1 Tax=Streptomyces sp. NPDC060232 TaxID=3347079 RepID=UPI00365252C2